MSDIGENGRDAIVAWMPEQGIAADRMPNGSAFGYARTAVQDADGAAIAGQIDAIRRIAAGAGLTISDIFIDDGVSGARFEREGLGKLLQASSRNPGSIVVIGSVDRLARDPDTLEHILRALNQDGARIVDSTSIVKQRPEVVNS